VITVNGVHHTYDSDPVLSDVDLTITAGQVTALVGSNGAGKSTLLSAISRLLRPDAGSVDVAGLDVHAATDPEVARRLAVLRQENHVLARLTVNDLVELGRFPHCRGRLGPGDHQVVAEVLEWVELTALRDRYLDQLSGGQRQRAHLAMVLAQDTEYLLLDEPLNNLDMQHAATTMDLVRRAADELGRTVVVVLHDVNAASSHADRIVGMRGGRVVVSGTPEEVMRTEVLREVFGMEIPVAQVAGHRIALHWTASGRSGQSMPHSTRN
jgi:iron complex transport system ATP-binding protein